MQRTENASPSGFSPASVTILNWHRLCKTSSCDIEHENRERLRLDESRTAWQSIATLVGSVPACDVCRWGWGGAAGQSTDMALSLLRRVSTARTEVAASVLQLRLNVSVTCLVEKLLASEERQSFP